MIMIVLKFIARGSYTDVCCCSLESLELIRFQIGKELKDSLTGLESLRRMAVWPDGGNQVTYLPFDVTKPL